MNKSKIIKSVSLSALEVVLPSLTLLLELHPSFNYLFLSAATLINFWGNFSQSRVNELVEKLVREKDYFNLSVISSDKFKSIFLSIIEKYIKESSERKRDLLKNYLVAVAKGYSIEFDGHTKLLSIIDQITPEELRLFILLPKIIADNEKQLLNISKTPVEVIEIDAYQIKMRLYNWDITEKEIENSLIFLNNYGLVLIKHIASGTIGGGGATDIDFAGLSNYGKIFYEFIDDPNFDKKIVPVA